MPIHSTTVDPKELATELPQQYRKFLEDQLASYTKAKNYERIAEHKAALICFELLSCKDKSEVSLYHKKRFKQWLQAKQTVADDKSSIKEIAYASQIIHGMVAYANDVTKFYKHIDITKTSLQKQYVAEKLKPLVELYNKRPFGLHTSNSLIALIPIIEDLLAIIEIQQDRGVKGDVKKQLNALNSYVKTCEQQILDELKLRLNDSSENTSLHPYINSIEQATKPATVGEKPLLKPGNYYPSSIAVEESSLGVKARLLAVWLNHPRKKGELNTKVTGQLLDISQITNFTIRNQQLAKSSQSTNQQKRYELQCQIAPTLSVCIDILEQLTRLEKDLKNSSMTSGIKQFLQFKQEALYQEASFNLQTIHTLIEKTRRQSVLGKFALGKETKKTHEFLTDIDQACIDIDQRLKQAMGNMAVIKDNTSYLQNQHVITEVVTLKGEALWIRDEIKHHAGSLSSKVHKYLIASSRNGNWQKYKHSLRAINDILQYSEHMIEPGIDLISGETRPEADIINFNPFDPRNVTHAITDKDQHYLGDFAALNNDQLTDLSQNAKQLRRALTEQKQILRSHFEKFSPLQKWWYWSLYKNEKRAIDTQLSLVVKPIENKINGEIYRRLKSNLRYGQLEPVTQAKWENILDKSHGFFCYNLNNAQVDTLLDALKTKERELQPITRSWFASSKRIQVAKREMANLKDMQRSLTYQQKMKVNLIQLTIDNEFARKFIADLEPKLGVLQTSWLQNLVQRKEVKMHEIQPNELKAIMLKLMQLNEKQPTIFTEFYPLFTAFLKKNGYFVLQFAGKELSVEELTSGLFSKEYKVEIRGAFATWLARHRHNLLALRDSSQVQNKEVSGFINELLELIPKQTLSYSTAIKDLLLAYNQFTFLGQVKQVDDIEGWMQAVKVDGENLKADAKKTALFLTSLKKDLKRKPNNDMLSFQISYLEQMLKQVKQEDNLLKQEFDPVTKNPLKVKYQEESDSTLNIIQEIIFQKANNDYYFTWLQATVRSELNRTRNIDAKTIAFMPILAGDASKLAEYKKALAIILETLEGKKAQITPDEQATLNVLDDAKKRAHTTTAVTSVYEGLLKKCEAHLNAMVTKPHYTAECRTQLANFADLVAAYKGVRKNAEYSDLNNQIKMAATAISKLLTKPNAIVFKRPDPEQKPLKSPDNIETSQDLWRAVLLVQLSKSTRETISHKLKEFVNNYDGDSLNLCPLMVAFCKKGQFNWQPGNEKILFDYANTYFDKLLVATTNQLTAPTASFSKSTLRYLLKQVPELHVSFNHKLAAWIKTKDRTWLKENQDLFSELPVSLENRIAYANIALAELLAEIPAVNANAEDKLNYNNKLKGFFYSTLGDNKTRKRWYPSYSQLDQQSKQQLDSIMQTYLASEFAIGNIYDDQIIAKFFTHQAPYLRDVRLKSLGRLLSDAVELDSDAIDFAHPDDKDIVIRYQQRLNTFNRNKPSTLLPVPTSEQDFAALDAMLNTTLGKAKWRKVVDQLLAGVLEHNSISCFIGLEYLSGYRLRHLQQLLKTPGLTPGQLQEFCDCIKPSDFTAADFNTLQDELINALSSSEGWTESLAKLASQFGNEVTQEIFLAKLFAKALKDDNITLVSDVLAKGGIDLFKSQQGQTTIIKELELYRNRRIDNANLTEKQTGYSDTARVILQIIDADYDVYKNTEVDIAIKPGQVSLEHGIAGLVQLAFADGEQTREEANNKLEAYVNELLPKELSAKLYANAKSWFNNRSLDELLLSLHEQLVEGPERWNANLFASAERYATAQVYDGFIISHAKQLLVLDQHQLPAFMNLLPVVARDDENHFNQFLSKAGLSSFAVMLDMQLAKWYKESPVNIVTAYQRLKDLIGLHLRAERTDTHLCNIDTNLFNQALEALLSLLPPSQQKQLGSEFLAYLNVTYQAWLNNGSDAVVYQPHQEFLTQQFEELFRKANGEEATELTNKVFKQYRLLHMLQTGENILATVDGMELDDITEQLATPASVESFMTWYVPHSHINSAYGQLLAENAKQINTAMLNLLTSWVEQPCAEDDVRYILVQNILSANYSGFLKEYEPELATQLANKFEAVTKRITQAKTEKLLYKNLLVNLHDAGDSKQFIELCNQEFIEKLETDVPNHLFSQLLDGFTGLIRVSMPGCKGLASDPLYAVLKAEVKDIPTDLLEHAAESKRQAVNSTLNNIGDKLRHKKELINHDVKKLELIVQVLEKLIKEQHAIKIQENILGDAANFADVAKFSKDLNDTHHEAQKLQNRKNQLVSDQQAVMQQCREYGISEPLDLVAMQQVIATQFMSQQQKLLGYKQLAIKATSLQQALQTAERAMPVFNHWHATSESVLLLNSAEIKSLAVVLDNERFVAFQTALTKLSQDNQDQGGVAEQIRLFYASALNLLNAARIYDANEVNASEYDMQYTLHTIYQDLLERIDRFTLTLINAEHQENWVNFSVQRIRSMFESLDKLRKSHFLTTEEGDTIFNSLMSLRHEIDKKESNIENTPEAGDSYSDIKLKQIPKMTSPTKQTPTKGNNNHAASPSMNGDSTPTKRGMWLSSLFAKQNSPAVESSMNARAGVDKFKQDECEANTIIASKIEIVSNFYDTEESIDKEVIDKTSTYKI